MKRLPVGVFARKGTKLLQVKVPTSERGGWVNRSTGTTDPRLAAAMRKMLEDIGPRHRRLTFFLDAIRANTLTVPELFDAWDSGPDGLQALKRKMLEVDLDPLVEQWLNSLVGHVALDTQQHYRKHVRSFIPANMFFPSARMKVSELARWLEDIPGKPATRRKYHAAMSRFCQYLIQREILSDNPMRNVAAPAAAPPRLEYLEYADVVRLLDLLPEPHKTFSALVHGTGLEVSVALGLRRRDFTREETGVWAIVARGTKTAARNRRVYLDSWAVPFVERYIGLLTPDAKLFPHLNRWTASDVHRAAAALLGRPNYWLRDARHTWAVRALRAGASPEVVRRQLGHANTLMVIKVYGAYIPRSEEMTSWHARALVQDRFGVA